MSEVHLTNREINIENQQQVHFLDKDKLKSDAVIVLVISSFLSFLQPFGMQQIGFALSWFFWLTMCLLGYIVYWPIIYYGQLNLAKLGGVLQKPWLVITLSACFASLVLSFFVPLVNMVFFGIDGDYLSLVPRVIPHCLVIGGFISFVSIIKTRVKLQQQQIQQQSQALETKREKLKQVKDEKIAQLMAKLPIEKRGELLCVEIDDHYLKVYTDKGDHLVLMRFKDALALVADCSGMQTHRSWWVALDAIVCEQKEGRKTLLKLSNGVVAPVSKTYLENVKQQLLLKQ